MGVNVWKLVEKCFNLEIFFCEIVESLLEIFKMFFKKCIFV